MLHTAPKMNAAVRILIMLNAYCPVVKVGNPFLELQQQTAKRRTRPLVGRGNYGRNIRAHFDSLPMSRRTFA